MYASTECGVWKRIGSPRRTRSRQAVAGDLQFGHVQQDEALADAGHGLFQRGPVDLHGIAAERHQRAELRQARRLMPRRQVAQAVQPHQEEELNVRPQLALEQLHHIHGIVGAGSVGIDAADGEVIGLRRGQLRHVDAVLEGREADILFVRRVAGGDEQHRVQLEMIARLFHQHEMADVDGVKGAAEDAHAAQRRVGIFGRH